MSNIATIRRPAPLLLNIGLAIGNTGQRLTLAEVVQATERAGFVIDALAVHDSATEPTAVIRAVDVGGLLTQDDRAAGLSTVLAQDCIAIYSPALQAGALYGPAADLWGAFDPAFFLTLDGAPLVDSQPVAA